MKLLVWERQFLRNILGGIKMEEETCRRSTNKEVAIQQLLYWLQIQVFQVAGWHITTNAKAKKYKKVLSAGERERVKKRRCRPSDKTKDRRTWKNQTLSKPRSLHDLSSYCIHCFKTLRELVGRAFKETIASISVITFSFDLNLRCKGRKYLWSDKLRIENKAL